MYCPNCGEEILNERHVCPVRAMGDENEAVSKEDCATTCEAIEKPVAIKFNRKWIKVFAILLLCVVATLGIAKAVFSINKAKMPWYELTDMGVLHFDKEKWDFYTGDSYIEIPKKFDGMVEQIQIDDFSGRTQYRYEGQLEELIQNHPWVIEQLIPACGVIRIECSDYRFEKSVGMMRQGAAILGRFRLTVGNYRITEGNMRNGACFTTLEDVLAWLETGRYEYAYDDLMGNLVYDSAYMPELGE